MNTHEVEALMSELGISNLPIESVAQVYENGISISKPCCATDSTEIEVEISIKNDRNHCVDVLDAIVAPFKHKNSCGLARVARFSSRDDFLAFSQRISLVLLAGFLAVRAGVEVD